MVNGLLRSFLASAGILAVLVAVAAATEETDQPEKLNWDRDIRVAWQEALKGDRPLLVFVTMDGCLHCEKMKKTTLQDPRVIRDLRSRFVPVALNAKHAPELVQRLTIRSFPTTVIIQNNGDVIESIGGYQTSQQLRQRLQATLLQAEREQGGNRRR